MFLQVLLSVILVITQPSSYLAGKVLRVKDGDTVVLLGDDTRTYTVRLQYVDCPEKHQAYGIEAMNYTIQQCEGKRVKIKNEGKYDFNKRLLGEVILTDGKNLNELLIQKGYAWHFVKYSKSKILASYEQKAKNQKLGLWQNPNAQAPWEWRKAHPRK